MKMSIFTAILSLFASNVEISTFVLAPQADVFLYAPDQAKSLFERLLPFFTLDSVDFTAPRLSKIGWSGHELWEGELYDEMKTVCFRRDYVPSSEECEVYAAIYDLTNDEAYRRCASERSWEIIIRFPQEQGFYRFLQHLAPYCNNP